MEKTKLNPAKEVEIKNWKMIRQLYINELCNYLSTGYTLIPRDKQILITAEDRLAKLQGRNSLSFEDVKDKFCKNRLI